MGAFDFIGTSGANGKFEFNPNFLQMLAGLGSNISQGKPVGQALGESVSGTITNEKMQNAAGQMFPNLVPTPKGTPGPDSVTTTQTADGTVHTIKTPSSKNLSTFGTSVPPEAAPGVPMANAPAYGQGGQPPFWKALLSK